MFLRDSKPKWGTRQFLYHDLTSFEELVILALIYITKENLKQN